LGDAPTLSQDFQNIEFDITPKRISSKNIWITKNKRIFEKKKIVSSFYQTKFCFQKKSFFFFKFFFRIKISVFEKKKRVKFFLFLKN